MKKIIVFLLPLLFSGCFTGRKVMDGTYEYKGFYGVSYEMTLHSDSSFTYSLQNGLNKGVTTGTWKKEGAELVLNGGTPPLKEEIVVQEELNSKLDSIQVKVTDFDSVPLGLVNVTLNGVESVVTDMKGELVIGKTNMARIKVNYLGKNFSEYNVVDSSANDFVIKVYTKSNPSVYFENTRVQVKGKKILVPSMPLTKTPIMLKRPARSQLHCDRNLSKHL